MPEPTRVPDHDLADLSASVRRLLDQSSAQADLLDRLSVDPALPRLPMPPGLGSQGAESPFILAMEGEAYEAELDALTDWVDDLLLPVYGREVTSSAPWCPWWDQHPEAVARLHALWLAWQQHIDPEAGPAGPAVWHRDHLDHTLAQLRSTSGPFAACTTDPERPSHRLLHGPKPASEPAPRAGGEE
ncbi:DUF4913 domain-containing protein [Streptomyces phyllanthi]|uniref:DUF4913 domain-containing protein n=1 Tax=Streptomyces phyllanthi TaxID=1803180 RepID=A0A5N8VX49_9ACTN|nr:DUF4913 domain-containing protein [Streptomyces phyllanthi]